MIIRKWHVWYHFINWFNNWVMIIVVNAASFHHIQNYYTLVNSNDQLIHIQSMSCSYGTKKKHYVPTPSVNAQNSYINVASLMAYRGLFVYMHWLATGFWVRFALLLLGLYYWWKQGHSARILCPSQGQTRIFNLVISNCRKHEGIHDKTIQKHD